MEINNKDNGKNSKIKNQRIDVMKVGFLKR